MKIVQTHHASMVGKIACKVVSVGLDGHVVSQNELADPSSQDSIFPDQNTEGERPEKQFKDEQSEIPNTSKLVAPEEVALGRLSWHTREHIHTPDSLN